MTMKTMPTPPHTFFIPVMGTGFTIDTPIHIAKYGISSVISLVDDVLIEQVRKVHCKKWGEPYEEIKNRDQDARARRITAYLNLVDRLVQKQVEELQASPFQEGSEITRYYEMLPESPLKKSYRQMLATANQTVRIHMEEELRENAVPGSIDVNIMTKLNRSNSRKGKVLPMEFNDALASLRGYAKSTLTSSIIFSAGINAPLYSYLAQFDDFFPDENGFLKKKIILKVSDYRSALIQGKFLAKKGLWISEYRIESGINCGGHAFPTNGYLIGPILEEFKEKRAELVEEIRALCGKALKASHRSGEILPKEIRITVQGGIATAGETELLMGYYQMDGTGWGTPFLLVPEVTNVDEEGLRKLSAAKNDDVYLSDASPLGIPFWNLRASSSEEKRHQRIQENNPGSPCYKGYLVSNTEFSKAPICTASRTYQKVKVLQLSQENILEEQFSALKKKVLDKSCICHNLGGGAEIKYDIDSQATPAICCGPNIRNFSEIVSLEKMIRHIYGELSILTNPEHKHMFLEELYLYIEYLKKEIKDFSLGITKTTPKYFRDFKNNLLQGIQYYRAIGKNVIKENQEHFLKTLEDLQNSLESLPLPSI